MQMQSRPDFTVAADGTATIAPKEAPECSLGDVAADVPLRPRPEAAPIRPAEDLGSAWTEVPRPVASDSTAADRTSETHSEGEESRLPPPVDGDEGDPDQTF